MINRSLPLSVQIKLAEEGLKHLEWVRECTHDRLDRCERGISEMYESPEKLGRIQYLSEIEIDLDNINGRIGELKTFIKEASIVVNGVKPK